MRFSLSLTTKMMIIMLAMIFTTTLVISSILIVQSNSSLSQQQFEQQRLNAQKFALYKRLFMQNVLLWVESVSALADSESADVKQLTQMIDTARDPLNMTMHVDNAWLYNANNKLVYGHGGKLPAVVTQKMQQVKQRLEPILLTECVERCQSYVLVPIMTAQEDVGVFILSSKMTWLLALLNESGSLDAHGIIKHINRQSANPLLQVIGPTSSINKMLLTRVLEVLPAQTDVHELVSKGVMLEINENDYLVNAVPLNEFAENGHYVLFVKDVSSAMQTNREYQRAVIGWAVVIFILFFALMYFFFNNYRQKLLDLSHRLPLLAQHRYQDFYLQSEKANMWQQNRFPDELDVLEKVTRDLATQLEEIDSKMALNTAQLERMAMFDPLTGLPNRNMLTFQIEQQLASSARDGSWVAIMFVDLDDFKKVNDSYGHDVGDRLLKAAAKRIEGPIRKSDIVSRFGGDEFVILLENLNDRDQVKVIVEKLLHVFSEPLHVDALQFYITISIGIAITKQAQTTSVDLLRHADIAMYEAKSEQGASFRLYDTSMNLRVMRKVEMESEARIALREDQFSLALQPQLDLKTRKLVGFEALIRWHHPAKGLIMPGEFIPLLENTAFMLELDYWVIAHGTRLLSELNGNGFQDIKFAINVSSAQFIDPSLPLYLQQQILLNKVDPACICLELTETALVRDIERATGIMKSIRDMGCKIAIDDFGTGYSSLSYLKALPTDYVKIDRSFVAGMLEHKDDRNIIFSIISMVSNMGLTVIAEGIENAGQYELLCQFDCHEGQGYLIGKPIPEANIWNQLKENVDNKIWTRPLPVFTDTHETQI
ncbi:bifunctional diguanylate cyclase/phosphodiesterase [Alteromonas sp. ASW11-130]|uniref:bifunctional diguanylate cyclase/phosphodiesterase n=1 Tax=Alteromonas sp. ASW11-130 TaxID=3015775 RepID=UPI00224280FB|nr:EAL domain-containing protein [Alteromonas sp. ASW11-130]MCW8091174.1 EAL domain-containing protein [Alteromonas sp. ASW11-130]